MSLIDEGKLLELVRQAVREVLDERQMVVSADALSKDQVAKMLGVSTRTITTYMKRESMPHASRMGRIEFQRDEVLSWWRDRGRPVPALKVV